MDCIRCKQPLEPGARFCRNCGLPVASPADGGTQVVAPSNNNNNQQGWPPPWPDQQQLTRGPVQPPSQAAQGWPPPWPDQQQEGRPSTQPSAPMQQGQVRLPGPQAQGPAFSDATQYVAPSPQGAPSAPQDSRQPWPPAQPVSPPGYYNVSQVPSPAPMMYSQANTGAKMPPAAVTTPRGRKRRGCLTVGLSTLLLLILVLAISWVFLIRPAIHDLIKSQVDQKVTDAINKIPPNFLSIAINGTIPVSQTIINSALALNVAPSDPVQDPNMKITPSGMRFEFKVQFVISLQCAISFVPVAKNGQIVATNVGVEGVVGLVMSPEEVTSLMNDELKKLQDHLKQNVTKVQLKDQEIDVTLGGGGSSGIPVTIPTAIPTNIPGGILPTVLPTLP